MADNSLPTSPSLDNLANENSVTTFEAIDTFMKKEEQSYEDFLGQFSYLNKSDVKKSLEKKHQQQKNKQPPVKEEKKFSTTEESKQKLKVLSPEGPAPAEIVNEIEEEVLVEGEVCGVMSKQDLPTQSSTKFDNFVVTEEEVSGEDIDDVDVPLGGYVCSFGEKQEVIPPSDKDKLVTTSAEKECEALTLPEGTIDGIQELDEENTFKDMLNPGEVDPLEEEDIQVHVNDRQLDYAAKYRVESDPVSQSTHTEVCSDEVQPFSLDEDFDYDNVILTPKFSAEDVALMKRLAEEAKHHTVEVT